MRSAASVVDSPGLAVAPASVAVFLLLYRSNKQKYLGGWEVSRILIGLSSTRDGC